MALLIYTLECVYALSSLGQTSCNAFLHCQGALDVLISLLTVEVDFYFLTLKIFLHLNLLIKHCCLDRHRATDLKQEFL